MHRKHKLSKRLPGLSLLNGNKAVFSVCLYVACQTITASFTWLKIITNKHNNPFWWLEATQFVKYSKQEYGQEKKKGGGESLTFIHVRRSHRNSANFLWKHVICHSVSRRQHGKQSQVLLSLLLSSCSLWWKIKSQWTTPPDPPRPRPLTERLTPFNCRSI